MKHIEQGYNECKLAVLAMLAGTSLEMVKALALSMSKTKSWDEVIRRKDGTFTMVNERITKLYRLEGKALNNSEILNLIKNVVTGNSTKAKRYNRHDVLPLDGKGELFIKWKDRSLSHTVVYENGVIFDPNENKELPFNQWFELSHIGPRVRYFIL